MTKHLPSNLDLLIARKCIESEGKVFDVGTMMTLKEWQDALGVTWGRFWNDNSLDIPTQQERDDYIKSHPPKFDNSYADAEKIASNPHLFEMLHQESGRFVEGEEEARAAILLVAAGMFCANAKPESSNLLINSESGAGKDSVTTATLGVFAALDDDKMVIKRKRIGPAVLTYWHSKDLAWSWDKRCLYLEDVSPGVLNSNVFKVFSSSHGGRATITKDQTAFESIIRGKPCLFVTTAESECKHEMLRRFPVLFLDVTKEHTRKILEWQATAAMTGRAGYDEPNQNIRDALCVLNRVKVVVPFADRMAKHMPDKLIMRTAFSRILDYCKFSAALHQRTRQRDAEGNVIAQAEDYNLARRVIKATTQSDSMTPLNFKQRALLDVLAGQVEPTAFSTLAEKHNPYSHKMGLLRALEFLRKNGLAKSQEVFCEQTHRNRSLWSAVSASEKVSVLPDWNVLQTDTNDTNDTIDTTDTKDTKDTKSGKVSSVSSVSSNIKPSDIIAVIQRLDDGTGVMAGDIEREVGQPVDSLFRAMASDGDIYAVKPDRWRVLE